MRISDWSSDVCSSDLPEQSLVVALGHDPHRGAIARGDPRRQFQIGKPARVGPWLHRHPSSLPPPPGRGSDPSNSRRSPASAPNSPSQHLVTSDTPCCRTPRVDMQACPASIRSEEHTSELQSLMRTSYAVFRL